MSIKSRALEMFRSGQRADCVIEVVSQIDGQDSEKQVCLFYCTLLGYALVTKIQKLVISKNARETKAYPTFEKYGYGLGEVY
jgi:hypothetical protein